LAFFGREVEMTVEEIINRLNERKLTLKTRLSPVLEAAKETDHKINRYRFPPTELCLLNREQWDCVACLESELDDIDHQLRIHAEQARHQAWMNEHLSRYNPGYKPATVKHCETCDCFISGWERFCADCQKVQESRRPISSAFPPRLTVPDRDKNTRDGFPVNIDEHMVMEYEDEIERRWDFVGAEPNK
jgi:hypothetical protein